MRRVLVAATMIFIMLHLLTVNPSAAETSLRKSLQTRRCHRRIDGPRREATTRKVEEALAYHWSFDNENARDSVRDVNGRIIGDVLFTGGVLGKAAVIQNDSTQIVMQSPNLDLNGWEQVTLSMWCKMKGYSTYGRVLSWAQGNQTCGLALHVGGDAGYWHAGAFYVLACPSVRHPGALSKGPLRARVRLRYRSSCHRSS